MESAKLCALGALMPNVLSCLTCPACSDTLCTSCLTRSHARSASYPSCSRASRVLRALCLTSLIPYVLSCLTRLISYMLSCLTYLVSYMLSCLTCFVPYVLSGPAYLVCMYLCINLFIFGQIYINVNKASSITINL